jgi:hypothetical protein
MTSLVDPLKLRTYGVKKPLDQKEEKIQQLYDQNKRYYPKLRNGETESSSNKITGQIDEWGAVVKHQVEMHERQRALQAEQDAHKKR